MVFQCLAFHAHAPIDLMFTLKFRVYPSAYGSDVSCKVIRLPFQGSGSSISIYIHSHACSFTLDKYMQVTEKKGNSNFYLDKEQPVLLFLAFEPEIRTQRKSGLALGLDMGGVGLEQAGHSCNKAFHLIFSSYPPKLPRGLIRSRSMVLSRERK